MKVVLLGLGAMGQRHARSIMGLEPDCQLVIADPYCDDPRGSHLFYRDWRLALAQHTDADCAIISSPHDAHLEQMGMLADRRIPFLVEKPICAIGQDAREVVRRANGLRCAVGFNYRFHYAALLIDRLREHQELRFHGQDDLVKRYGATVGETVASHPLDTALRLFGPIGHAQVSSDGVHFTATLVHTNEKVSRFDYRMDTKPRESFISWDGASSLVLPPDEESYAREMDAFLLWAVHGKERDERLATLADGLAVQEILSHA